MVGMQPLDALQDGHEVRGLLGVRLRPTLCCPMAWNTCLRIFVPIRSAW